MSVQVPVRIIAEEKGRNLVFHVEKCGIRFENIACVYDWKEENPILLMPRPLGINAVQTILNEITRLKGR